MEGEWDECGPQARTFSYRHTSSGGVMGGMVAITNNAIVDIRKFPRVDLKSSHHGNKTCNYSWQWMFTKFTVVIISQWIRISNHYGVHLN